MIKTKSNPSSTRALRSRSILLAVFLSTVLAVSVGCRTPEGDTNAEKRSHINKTNTVILNAIYAGQPGAKAQVANSVGYATFSTIEMKAMIVGSGNGYGLATDRRTGKTTYVNVRKLHVGFGAGIQNLQVLLIFNKKENFDGLLAGGWTFGGGADAALKTSDEEEEVVDMGMQASLEADPIVYQLTEKGIALGVTGEGLKINVDEDLN
jgi:lipid-binding SYLF domain-containing protein